ncbi:MAG: glutathione peroxidase [Planctomycetes bacterium]|nr:glutathione peroxidase [Planctomycetota bacterium]
MITPVRCFAGRFALSFVAIVATVVATGGCSSSTTQDEFPKEVKTAVPTLYDLKTTALAGGAADLAQYRGKVTLVVNVASECGLTPQYEGLQKLHEALSAKGFSVLGFPSNEFGGQEPGTAAQIQTFCTSKYAVTFPMFSKVEVKNGPGQDPVYQYLTTATGKEPGWNFAKYLVAKDGHVVAFFNSMTKPDDAGLRKAIDAELAK